MNVNAKGSSSAGGTAVAGTYAFPTTFAQQRLWFLEQLQPGGTSYLIPWFLRATGKLNAEALARSLNQVIERHEILRTTFSWEDGRPVQVVHPALMLEVPLRDISTSTSPVAEAERLAREEAGQPLDLERGPLVRAQLLRLSEEDHVLLLTLHHIIFDGGSRRTLVRELAAFYEANCTGKLAQLPPPKLQYADYAVWQRKNCQGAALERHLAYWRKQLAGSPARLELPSDHPRPAVQSFNGAKIPIAISKDLAGRLSSFSRSQGATLFMTLLAAFQTLLSRWSNQEDIVVGTPIANRNRAELEDMMGFFANTLALRTRFTESASFADVLAEVRETTLGAYDHQDLPFEKLVEEIHPQRNLSQNPLFQVLFSLQNLVRPDFELPGLKLRFMDLDQIAAKFDISVFLAETPDGIAGRLEYNTDLFDRETIERLVVHYRQLLDTVVAHPEIRVSDIPLMTEGERRQVLTEWNATASDYPRDRCLHQLIEEQAARTPHAIAVRMGEDQISYGSLNERANQLAWALRKRGAGPGQRVGICVERSIPMMVGLVGIMKTGAAYVPLDPAYPAERIKLILADGQPAVVITQEALAATLPRIEAPLICLDSHWPEIAKESTAALTDTATPEDLVYVIFTSGSTGKPKGVEIRHRSVVNLLTFMAAELDMGPRDVFPALASFAFDMSVPELYLALVSGGQVVLADRHMAGDGEALSALLVKTGATIIHATPTTWNLLLQAGFTGKGYKRAIGAEAVPQNLCDRLLAADPALYNFYGPTESTVWSTFHRFAAQGEPVTVGRPLANTQVYVLDQRRQPVPVGVTGEIYIAGDGVARGYLNRPDLTKERFLPDPFSDRAGAVMYKTGDLGRFLRDGRIDLLGRADNQVKLRGYRIELGEIESALNQHASVRECVVSAAEDVRGSQRLVAYVIPVSDGAVNVAELRAWLKQRLPEYMVPAAVVELKAFPLTPNGKVDRQALPLPESVRLEPEPGDQAACTPTEEVLAAIWSDVLKLSPIGIHRDFFDLGGHSLLATQVVARIREVFQIELPLRALFEAPTIAGLAEKIKVLQGTARGLEAPLKPVRRDQALPLSFAQQRLWFLDKLEPNHPLYNVPQVMRLQGTLDSAALERALNEVIARHESLRTTFPIVDSSPVEQIAPSLTLTLNQTDLSTLPEAVRESEARRLAVAEISRPFHLESGPLLRAALIGLGQLDHVFLLNTHHIISDRWSMNRLWQEMVEAYEREVSGVPPAPAQLAIQYADYAVWQREYLSGQALEKQLSYWKQMLAGAPTSLDLPTDRPRPARQSFRGSRQTVVLPRQLGEELKALGQREGTTLFMTLLAAFNVLLMRYSGQDDIVIGSPIAGRTRPELEKVIGLFVNTLALRTRLEGNPSFRELLCRVREMAMGAYAHQDLPFEKLVEELRPERDLSRNPLFQVMFILQNVPPSESQLRGVEVSSFSLPGESSKFDLTLIALESREGLRTTLEYNTDLFDAATIERLMRHFAVLLEAAVANPDLGVRNLPLLTDREREHIVYDWNRTATDYPRDRAMYQRFEDQAERTPQAVAARFGGQAITYSELNRRANQLARYLRHLGVGRETLVGFYLERSLNMLIALLGVQKAGAAYVPLDPAYPAERLGFIVEDAQMSVLLTEQALVAWARDCAAHIAVLDREADREAIGRESEENLAPLATSEDRVYVLYTSGSTGKPKGVEIEHGSLANFLSSIEREPGFRSQDRLLAVTTLSFDIAGLELYLPLVSGGEIVLASREEAADGRRLLRLLHDSKPTVMQATPATWRMLIEAGWQGSPELKILCGGEALPGDLSAQLLPRCAELWNMYGPTETTIWSSVYRVTSAAATVPIGRPLANTTFHILDSGMQVVPVGAAGELYIGGEGVARGYFRRPELTVERFVPDPFAARPGARLYRTGDLARYLPDGNVQYLGRSDFQVKVRGFRIELGEIEAVLAEHPAVQQGVVAVREDSPGDQRLIAYVVAKAQQHLTISEARAHLKQSLPDYMLPSAIVELERLPLTPNGKVDRQALPKPDYAPAAAAAIVTPRDEIEAQLLNIWREVLQLRTVAVTDNFFEVGGHSLLAVRLVDEIRKATGVEIPLTALFQDATVEHLANIVRGTEAVSPTVAHQLQAGSKDRAPFFAAVLAGMNALGYVPLAKHLGPEQAFYALQRPGPGPRAQRRPYSQQEYEEVAAEYVRAMRSIQPDGPYYIGGTCEGARIAFEMARILEAEGERVDLLALIDTWVLENAQNRFLWKFYYYYDQLRRMTRQSWKARLNVVSKAATNRLKWWTGARSAPRKSEWIGVYWPKNFIPHRIKSRITVFKIPKQPFYYRPDPQLGWGTRTKSGVDIELVPHGKHLFLLREPYVRELATALARTLDRLQLKNAQPVVPIAVEPESADAATISH